MTEILKASKLALPLEERKGSTWEDERVQHLSAAMHLWSVTIFLTWIQPAVEVEDL